MEKNKRIKKILSASCAGLLAIAMCVPLASASYTVGWMHYSNTSAKTYTRTSGEEGWRTVKTWAQVPGDSTQRGYNEKRSSLASLEVLSKTYFNPDLYEAHGARVWG